MISIVSLLNMSFTHSEVQRREGGITTKDITRTVSELAATISDSLGLLAIRFWAGPSSLLSFVLCSSHVTFYKRVTEAQC